MDAREQVSSSKIGVAVAKTNLIESGGTAAGWRQLIWPLVLVLALSFTFSAMFYLRNLALGDEQLLFPIVIWQIAVWLPWILFLPFAERLAVRFPVDAIGWVTLHIIIALVIVALHAPWFVWVSSEISPYRGLEDTRFGVFRYFFIFWSALDLLLYAATLGHIRSRWVQRKIREQEMHLAVLELRLSKSENEEGGHRPGSQPEPLRLEHFTVRRGSERVMLSAADIVWIEAEDYCTRFHTITGSHLVRISLATLEKRLDSSRFIRIHRSTIINVDHLKGIDRLPGGECVASLINGVERRVSRSGYVKLKNRIEMLS